MNMIIYNVITIVVTTLTCSANHESLYIKNGLLIENATILTYNSKENFNSFKGYIAIDSSKIIYVGKNKPLVKGNFKVLKAEGKYVIPGLIDSHVHLANIAGMNVRHKMKHPDLAYEYFNQLPKSFLYFGYTTLIDVNNYAPGLINNILQKEVRPDIYTCGEQVQIMNDFMMEMEEYSMEQRYQMPFLYDHHNHNVSLPDSIKLETHTNKSIIRNIVEEQSGICIKVLYEDESSGMKVTWEKPSTEIINELVQESKKYDAPVIIHAPSFEGQKFALETNIDIIAHAMWNWSSDPLSLLDTTLTKAHKDLLNEFCKRKTGYQPTFRAILGEIDILKETLLSDTIIEHIYSDNYLSWIKSDEGQWAKTRILNRPNFIKNTNPDFYYSVRKYFETDEEMMKTIYERLKIKINTVTNFLATNNANLLFSTDGGAMNMYTTPPGYNGYLEMLHWYEAGVTLDKIFKAATFNCAEAFHLNNVIGTIENDKIANLLILNKNPLMDIEAYNNIDKVILHGNIINRSDLSAKK